MNGIKIIGIAALGLLVAGTALAQEAAVPVEPPVVDQLIDSLGEIVLTLLGIAIVGATTWARAWVKARLSAEAQNTVLIALDRAASLAMAAGASGTQAGTNYLKRQVPDALRRLKMDDAQIRGLIEAEVEQRKSR